jgi:hypothetical protein
MKYNCPLCNTELVEQVGNKTHSGDPKYGIGLYCPSVTCPAQEVAGHGDKASEAFAVIQAKYQKA